MNARKRTIKATMLLVLSPIAFADPPQRLAPDQLGQDGRITLTPAFTPDGKTIYFAQSECSLIWECPQYLKTSTLGPEGWSAPRPFPLPQLGRADWPTVSPDGLLLLFSWAVDRVRHRGKNVATDFDLYTVRLDQPGATPQPLDEPDINRIRGGQGGTDLFASSWVNDGWYEPVNLGPEVNSGFEDFSARLTPDGKALVFTSDRPVSNRPKGILQVWTVDVDGVPGLARLLAAGSH